MTFFYECHGERDAEEEHGEERPCGHALLYGCNGLRIASIHSTLGLYLLKYPHGVQGPSVHSLIHTRFRGYTVKLLLSILFSIS